MLHAFFSLFFPVTCLGCKKFGTSICKRCISLTRKSLSSPHSNTLSHFDYKDPLVRKAIHAMKYRHRKDIILPLASSLAEELKKLPSIENYRIIPIPMPVWRKFSRGYNQAEEIAHVVGTRLTIPVATNILRRTKNSIRQVTAASRQERLANQRGSFEVTNDVSGMHLLLIDDVTTTGATLAEARAALLRKGACSVYAATLAH